jgi:hypothetical protein
MNLEPTIEDMIADLEGYYEAAGFSGIYERELKNKTEEEIREMHKQLREEASARGENDRS